MRSEHAQADGMGPFPPRWRALLAVCALAALFVIAGCGSDNAADQTSANSKSPSEAIGESSGGGTPPSQSSGGSSGTGASATGGGDKASGGSSSSGGASGSSGGDKVAIVDFDYDPKDLQVDAGTKVTFTNEDTAAHTATADDSSFDTGDLDKGDSKAIAFDKPGTYKYYCRFHAFMKATVTVK